MSLAYARGFGAAKRDITIAYCPYEGHTVGSLALQREWMAGHFDALQPQPAQRKSHHLTRRHTIRKRWPRSQYARRRVFEELGITRVQL